MCTRASRLNGRTRNYDWRFDSTGSVAIDAIAVHGRLDHEQWIWSGQLLTMRCLSVLLLHTHKIHLNATIAYRTVARVRGALQLLHPLAHRLRPVRLDQQLGAGGHNMSTGRCDGRRRRTVRLLCMWLLRVLELVVLLMLLVLELVVLVGVRLVQRHGGVRQRDQLEDVLALGVVALGHVERAQIDDARRLRTLQGAETNNTDCNSCTEGGFDIL